MAFPADSRPAKPAPGAPAVSPSMCGGSNGARVRLWKVALQKFADETGLPETGDRPSKGRVESTMAGQRFNRDVNPKSEQDSTSFI